MTQKHFIKFSGIVFAIVSLLHLIRVLYSWPLVIGTWEVPVLFSIATFLVTGYFAWSAWKLRRS